MPANQIVIEGKIVRVEVRKAGDSKVLNLTLGCYNGQKAEKPLYIDVEQWNPTSEVRKELKSAEGEGRAIVAGIMRQDHWENDDGDNRSKIKVLANSIGIAFDPPPRDDEDDDDEDRRSRGKKSRGKKNTSSKKKKGKKKSKRRSSDDDDDEDDDDEEEEDDDVPF